MLSLGDNAAVEMYIGVLKAEHGHAFVKLKKLVLEVKNNLVKSVISYNKWFKWLGKIIKYGLFSPFILVKKRKFAINKWEQKVCYILSE